MAFPTYNEFRFFLENNKKRRFDQGRFYTCAMAICAGGPVSEGYADDVDRNAPDWFKEFERRTSWTRPGIWKGKHLLDVLLDIDPDFRAQSEGCEPQ